MRDEPGDGPGFRATPRDRLARASSEPRPRSLKPATDTSEAGLVAWLRPPPGESLGDKPCGGRASARDWLGSASARPRPLSKNKKPAPTGVSPFNDEGANRMLQEVLDGQHRMEAMLTRLCGRWPISLDGDSPPDLLLPSVWESKKSESLGRLGREGSKSRKTQASETPGVQVQDAGELVAQPAAKAVSQSAEGPATRPTMDFSDVEPAGAGVESGELAGFRSRVQALRPRSGSATRLLGVSSSDLWDDTGGTSGIKEEVEPRRCVMHPDSNARLFLDICAILVLAYDSIEIPVLLAWNLDHAGEAIMARVTFAFWAFDTLMGFFSGYHTPHGEVVTDQKKIAARYFRTTLMPNLLGVVCDGWALTSSLLAVDGVGTLLRLVRLPRIFRLVAMLKLGRFEQLYLRANIVMHQYSLDHFFNVFLAVNKIVVLTMWMCHMFACLWQVVGEHAIDMYYDNNELQDLQSDFVHSYLLALYWSVSVLLAASSIFDPQTTPELLLTISCLLVGVFACSFIIGIITDTLQESRRSTRLRTDQFRTFRKYLKQCCVPSTFAVRLETQVRQRYDMERARVLEDEVEMLEHISPSMKDVLRTMVYRSVVFTQPFIRSCAGLTKSCLSEICTIALKNEVLHPGNFAFELGDEASGSYFVYWGDFEYLKPTVVRSQTPRGRASAQNVETRSQEVGKCQWICEIALFCHWDHCGSMRAATVGEVLSLSGKQLIDVLQQVPRLQEIVQEYSRNLSRAIKERRVVVATELRLPVSHEEVLQLLPVEHRAALSQAGLEMLGAGIGRTSTRTNFGLRGILLGDAIAGILTGDKGIMELSNEVVSGTCDLVVHGQKKSWSAPLEEQLLRVVSLVALRLQLEDGRVLVQLGRLTSDASTGRLQFKPTMKLPGEKVRSGELPSQTLERFLEGPLAGLREVITTTSRTVEEDLTASASYRVQTKYVRHIISATLATDWRHTCRRYELVLPSATANKRSEVLRSVLAEAFTLHHEVVEDTLFYSWMALTDMHQPELAQELVEQIDGMQPQLRPFAP